MEQRKVLLYRAGPVYLNGEHILTFVRDVFVGDISNPDDVIRPDGSKPVVGGLMTVKEEIVLFLGRGEQA